MDAWQILVTILSCSGFVGYWWLAWLILVTIFSCFGFVGYWWLAWIRFTGR